MKLICILCVLLAQQYLRLQFLNWNLYQVPAQNALTELVLTGKLTSGLIDAAQCWCWTTAVVRGDHDPAIDQAFVEAAEENLPAQPRRDDAVQNFLRWTGL